MIISTTDNIILLALEVSASGPAGHRSIQKWYESPGRGARVLVRIIVESIQRRGMVFLYKNLLREWPSLSKFKFKPPGVLNLVGVPTVYAMHDRRSRRG
eukprot:SAG31_NODE_318_length_17799_cov_79.857571_3_plen_99_part_00